MVRAPIPWRRLLAEGFVIVAGVLIALAADRLMQRMDDRVQERVYLDQLLAEFELADSILQVAGESAAERLAGAQLMVDALDGTVGDSVSGRDLTFGIAFAYWLEDPEVPREAWSDLLATGRIGLIESEALRREIAEFYRFADQQSAFHLEWVEYVRPYREAANAILSPEVLLALAQHRIDQEPVRDALIPSLDGLLRAAAASPALASAAGDVLPINWAAVRQYGALSERARSVADRIRDELGG